ncbi:uncharacterized protein perm1b [Larimichthys crocea]|uniref:uncharacterized protein perm1b n=1 Tax=Larimichthys crocea TaxID=215358 RepID=UPI000F5FEC07|nr:uncharacterized protein LOC104931361 [Larimichthys crocea]
MDDLDHSMRIAEYDWVSFYDDSEECGLLQPSLAWPDNSSLSDSEDSELKFNAGQQEPRQSPAANSDEAESNAAGCCMEEVQINQSGSAGEQDLAAKAEEDTLVKPDVCLGYAEGNTMKTEEVFLRTAEETNESVTTTLQTDVKRESDTSIHGPDLLCCNQTEEIVKESHTSDRAASEGVSIVTLRAEKERWFVTLNDIPARQRVRATSVKKKRRQKKPCKNNHVCRTLGQEKSLENSSELKITKDNNESEGGRERECVTQSNQNSGGYPSVEGKPESAQTGVISEVSQMCLTSGEGDNLSEQLVAPHLSEPTIHGKKHETNSSASTSHDTFTDKEPSRMDSVESDELGDSAEFFSTHSYDSESYLSATESVEEPLHPPMESQQLQSSSPLTKNCSTENTDADDTQDREVHSCHSTVSCNVTHNCEVYESTGVEPTFTFPCVTQSVNKMPDDSSTCDNDTHSTVLHTPSDTPGFQKHDINLSASGCSSGDQFSLPSVPDVILTPCSVADSPETYAEAVGNTRPVFAISAFWDEMEKLTINDILQLRVGRSTPPRDMQETARPNVDDFPRNESSLVDTGEYNSSDGGLMDTDTTDSDYFTQTDESKPDRSSCDFSSSDFEEEYWQFLGTSRNSSPDPQSKNQQRTKDSCFFAREEEDSTGSEGKETPVPSEDFAGEGFEDQDSNGLISSDLAWPRRITKSKSVRNIRDLNTEDLSSRLLLGNDENSPLLSSCPSLEENLVLKSSDSLETLIPAHFLSNTDILDEHTQITFPDVFFTEDKVKTDSRCITVYDPEDISVAPMFDYTVCAFRDETSFSSLSESQCSEEKPIPIFSCCHPTVRELTIPNPGYVFLSAGCKERGEISPIKVVSRSLIQDISYRTSAASGFHSWKSFLSIRKIRFQDKGSIWCSESGAWVFPAEAEKITIKTADPPITAVIEGTVCSTPSQLCRELAMQQRILETIQTTRREGIFSTLKQSDMCLVCIAFASWVLRSSDPEAADTWKAALLANVSALSAIQYLRQYVKKKKPFQDDP